MMSDEVASWVQVSKTKRYMQQIDLLWTYLVITWPALVFATKWDFAKDNCTVTWRFWALVRNKASRCDFFLKQYTHRSWPWLPVRCASMQWSWQKVGCLNQISFPKAWPRCPHVVSLNFPRSSYCATGKGIWCERLSRTQLSSSGHLPVCSCNAFRQNMFPCWVQDKAFMQASCAVCITFDTS